MAAESKIEWCDATWNPILGCSMASEGCRHCYAAYYAATRAKNHPARTGLAKLVYEKGDLAGGRLGRGVFNGKVRWWEPWYGQPYSWKKPKQIFVCAHSDLFHESVPDGWVMRVLKAIFENPQHRFLILTKRAHRMRAFMEKWSDTLEEDYVPKLVQGPEAVREAHPSGRGQLFADMLEAMGTPPAGAAYPFFDWMEGMIRWPDYPINAWFGTSVEDACTARERIPELLKMKNARVLWVSMEPLLKRTTLRTMMGDNMSVLDALEGRFGYTFPLMEPTRSLDWVVVGGESGPGARYMDPDWARQLRDECHRTGTAFFMKQMARKAHIPGDLMIREYPND